MNLNDHVEALRRSLTAAAAAAGAQTQETARLLADTMEPAVRLTVIDALSTMAAEITTALDGALVDIRVRGGEPEVVVTPAAAEPDGEPPPSEDLDDEHGTVARISLRMPETLKARAEAAAAAQGVSLNAWLIGVVNRAVGQPRAEAPFGRGPRRYTGFARS